MTQRIIEINSPSFIPEGRLASPGDFAAIFGNDNPLALEIGCGLGDFILQIAQQKPHLNFLAIDIYNKGCFKTCKKIDLAGSPNVRVMRIEARYLLARYLKRESLAEVYINCPDPWPKKRHRSRRLVNHEFLQLAFHSLQPNGEFHFSTDFVDYGIAVGNLLEAEPGFTNLQATPYSHELGDYPISKYMRRFLDLGQPIYYCHFLRRADYRLEAAPAIRRGFRSRWVGRADS
jgi:tRNA (guanine-N7-)-methyltransferase